MLNAECERAAERQLAERFNIWHLAFGIIWHLTFGIPH
jgi:hypothetical protein